MDNNTLGTVKLTRIEAAIEQVKKHYENEPERVEDIEVSFEYIIGSFFPKVYDNIRDAMKTQRTLGYIDGRNEVIEEIIPWCQSIVDQKDQIENWRNKNENNQCD